jgi:hypothetical protein
MHSIQFALQITDPSSRQRRRPQDRAKQLYGKRKEKEKPGHGPQGSVLSATIYNLFVRDLAPPPPQAVGVNLAVYADDTCL